MSSGPSDFVVHHLTNLSSGDGFMTIHWDTMFFSIGLGYVFYWIFRKAAVGATSGVPAPNEKARRKTAVAPPARDR